MAKKIQAVWAIDIGQAALKALKLMPGDEPDKLFAEAFDYIEYPKILSQPDADAEELVREALATFLGRNDVKGCKVALGVSGQAGLVKFIKLPPVEKKRIPDIVKFEARQQIPFALEEVIWDYQQIGGDDDEGGDDGGFTLAEVGLFAMKRDQINRAMLPLKNAGIEVDLVQMGPIALYNFASVDRKLPKDEEKAQGAVVYVDIGADNSDLIITDGARIWQRNVPIGGNHFTRALTKELKLTFAKAEHLKRNATKAPDPRAVFTAMRGVFNDFSSEINRSIGFYASTNRNTKIAKVIGLGNGFKLPGLQKFLQQNLSYEVEKLDSFERLVGDEVVTAPQFIENLPSFAIAYGLAAQGLGKAPMRTNLIPPEIEQVRMVRRKKPWALAASTLFLLAFCVLFTADWHAWSKATSPDFVKAVNDAKAATTTGASLKSAYDAAKSKFDTEINRGKALVDDSANTEDWPALLKLVNSTIPDPARELKRDADKPENFDFLSRLAVHIDSIVPRYRENVETGWFSDPVAVNRLAKDTMHVYDRTTPPTGPGWIIQVVGHHYNPGKDKKKFTEKENAYNEGPSRYIQKQILPRFWVPELRAMGVHHAAMTWMSEPDRAWTPERPARNILAVMLAAEKPKSAAGAAAGSGRLGGGSESFAGTSAMSGGGGMGMGMEGMMGGMAGGGSAAMAGRGNLTGEGGVAGAAADKGPELKTLTRTDFKIDFIWQPPNPAPKPENLAALTTEIKKKLSDAVAKSKGAVDIPIDEAAMTKASTEASARFYDKNNAAPPGAPPVAPPGAPPTSK